MLPPSAYARHSTLPPSFAMYPPAMGVERGGSRTPSYGNGSLATVYSPAGHEGTGVLGISPSLVRRHRSATPHAPLMSSNLAYAQPVVAHGVGDRLPIEGQNQWGYPTPVTGNDPGNGFGIVGEGYPESAPHQQLQAYSPATDLTSASSQLQNPSVSASLQGQNQFRYPNTGAQISDSSPAHASATSAMSTQIELSPDSKLVSVSVGNPSRQGQSAVPTGWGWKSYEPATAAVAGPHPHDDVEQAGYQ